MDQTQQFLAELDGIVLQEVKEYQRLVDLQQEAQRLLVAQALQPFLANLQAKEHLARTIARLEKQRLAVSAALAPLLSLPATEVTLQTLSAQVDEPYASRFRHYRAQLQQLVTDLQRLNGEHAQLLRDSLAFVQTALTFFERLMPAQPTYLQSGKFASQKRGRLLSGRA
jgi:hypothetical protein